MYQIKMALRENQYPYFSDEELEHMYESNNRNVKNTIYQGLITKSEDTSLIVSGLTCSDTSKYFRRLASHYRPSHSGILGC